MSILRANDVVNAGPGTRSLDDATALYLIRDSVARRRSLIYGRLDGPDGEHCALGCFWQDNPKASLSSLLIDEVAAVNDSLPKNASGNARWKKVKAWLNWKLKLLELSAAKP